LLSAGNFGINVVSFVGIFDLYLVVNIGKKLKCTLVQALRLRIRCTAHRGIRGIVLFHDYGTRRG
jgi:hypothetical protein